MVSLSVMDVPFILSRCMRRFGNWKILVSSSVFTAGGFDRFVPPNFDTHRVEAQAASE